MTPAERRDAFQKSIVADLDQAPPELLARTRARVERIIADADSSQPR